MRMRSPHRLLAALALGSTLVLAACGSDDDSGNTPTEQPADSMTDDSMTDDSMTDDSMTDDSMTDDSMTDDSMTDDSMTEESPTSAP